MTNEEASFILANIDRRVCDDELNDALDVAIKALEQQSCEDCISREAVKDMLDARGIKAVMTFDHFKELLDKLPSVTPQPKIGHWIEKDGFDGDTYYDCSECGESFCLIDGTPTDNLYNYCPNCGAKMTESEEER